MDETTSSPKSDGNVSNIPVDSGVEPQLDYLTLTTSSAEEVVPISEAEQNELQCQIFDAFDTFPDDDIRDEEDEVDDVVDDGQEQRRDEADVQRRTARLGGVREGLESLCRAKSTCLEDAVKRVADACRDPKWRIPVGNAGILTFLLEVFRALDTHDALKIQILRLVGNSCADTDDNRARVVTSESIPHLIKLVGDKALQPYALPVLHNICVDYEPAQKRVIQEELIATLLDVLQNTQLHSESLTTYTPKLLDLMANHDSSQTSAPDSASVILLKYTVSERIAGVEDFVAFATTAARYLTTEKSQQYLTSENGLPIAFEVFEQSYTRFDDLDEEDTKSLIQWRSQFIQTLADISELAEFAALVLAPSSPVATTLRTWLASTHTQLQTGACMMLGNIARNDTTCILLVQDWEVQKELVSIVTSANDSHLLYATVGFLKNLALPLDNKSVLGEAGLIDVLPRIWQLDVLQQVQFSSISLSRQLLINTPANVNRLSQASSTPTNLDILSGIFAKSDIEPVKMEISRLITTICRVLNTPSTTQNTTQTRTMFFENKDTLIQPLAFMITQSKWPAIRSEAWFVFALTARSNDGAKCISRVILLDEVHAVLSDLLAEKSTAEGGIPVIESGKSGDVMEESNKLLEELSGGGMVPEEGKGKQSEEMKRVDRMNVLVLLTEVLKNEGSDLSTMERQRLEELVQRGGKTITA